MGWAHIRENILVKRINMGNLNHKDPRLQLDFSLMCKKFKT